MLAVVVALLWILSYFGLANYGVYLLPRVLAQKMTLSAYLALVQLLVTSFGIFCVLLAARVDRSITSDLLPLTQRANIPRGAPLNKRVQSVVLALLLAPSLYVLAHSLGMYLAYETLLQELAQKGVRAVQEQTGELGRSTLLDAPVLVLSFTVLVAPLGEELLFRGALFGAILRVTRKLLGARAQQDDAISTAQSDAPSETNVDEMDASPDSLLLRAGLPQQSRYRLRLRAWAQGGGIAWLGSSLVFAVMHMDTPGGMGILRAATASTLGFVCGWARMKSGALLFPWALHAGYNLLSLATLRGWIVFAHFPPKYALPTILLVVAPLGLVLSAAQVWLMKKHGTALSDA